MVNLQFWRNIKEQVNLYVDRIASFVKNDDFNNELDGKQRDIIRRIETNLTKAQKDLEKLYQELDKKYGMSPQQVEQLKKDVTEYIKDFYLHQPSDVQPDKVVISKVDYGDYKLAFTCVFWHNYFQDKELEETWEKLYNQIHTKFKGANLSACASTTVGTNEEQFVI